VNGNSPQFIKLGPLFPRPIAGLLSVVIVGVCWILPLASSADSTEQAMAFLLGCAFLSLFFVPRLGVIEIDPQARVMTFREGFTARSFHLWRRREVRQVSLPTGSTVVIGEWLDASSFAALGVKRKTVNGDVVVLLQQRFAFNGPTARFMAKTLRDIEGIKIQTVRLDNRLSKLNGSPNRSTQNPKNRTTFDKSRLRSLRGFERYGLP
jgi:uncharacterized membrane protein (Fun14 family)